MLRGRRSRTQLGFQMLDVMECLLGNCQMLVHQMLKARKVKAVNSSHKLKVVVGIMTGFLGPHERDPLHHQPCSAVYNEEASV